MPSAWRGMRPFCFYYADNLDALRDAGAELVFFSPLQADALPEVDGLISGGRLS